MNVKSDDLPADMQALASGELEELKAGVNQLERQLDVNQDAFFAREAELERFRFLTPLADAVLDHADQHCRAFPIATAPMDGKFLAWTGETWTPVYWYEPHNAWLCATEHTLAFDEDDPPTHWTPLPPPPSNPPLPAVFVELGQALEKIKSGT